MSYGVLPTGFSQKYIDDILRDFEARQKTQLGADINVGAEGILGQFNGTFGAAVAEAWDVLAAVYRSLYPDSATDEALDNVVSITGVKRLPATKSTIRVQCVGTPGTFLEAGRVISTVPNNDRFVSPDDATIGGGGQVAVFFEAEEFGPIVATAGTHTIETPVSGWDSAISPEDGDVGRNLETDPELRLRRETLLRAQGNATIEAIRAKLLLIDEVIQAFVFENVAFITDPVTQRPPRSFECLVRGGDDTAIAQQIFDSKAAGTFSYGHTGQKVTESIIDSQGIEHVIEFTRPLEIKIYIEVNIQVLFDYAGDDAVKLALATFGDTLGVAEDVVSEQFQAQLFTVSGVYDLTDFRIDTVTPPTNTGNIEIGIRDIATFDTSRITINSTPVT